MVAPFARGNGAVEMLMEIGKLYASAQLRAINHLHPQVFIHGPDGITQYAPCCELTTGKDIETVKTVRMICIAVDADAVVLASDAWAAYRMPDDPRPSEMPNRQRVVLLLGETRHGQVQQVLPVLRLENGEFHGLGAAYQDSSDLHDNANQNYLCPEVPDEKTRKQARIWLENRGFFVLRKRERGRDCGMGYAP